MITRRTIESSTLFFRSVHSQNELNELIGAFAQSRYLILHNETCVLLIGLSKHHNHTNFLFAKSKYSLYKLYTKQSVGLTQTFFKGI